jgi:hypothetical protein
MLVRLLKALADPSRLKLLGLLAGRELSVSELAEKLDLREPTVSHHLARLSELELVAMKAQGTTHRYRLRRDVLHRLSRDLFTVERVASIADNVAGERWERKVLRTYFEGDRLIRIPTTRKKRNVILNWLVTQFDSGVRYPESRVNEIIKRHHADTATLRREMIITGLMERKDGIYWRTEKERAAT